MKTCDHCGTMNYTVKLNKKKKRVCYSCGKVMTEFAESHPVLGESIGDGNHKRNKIPLSDDL